MLFKFQCELINLTNAAANVGTVFQEELKCDLLSQDVVLPITGKNLSVWQLLFSVV